MRQTIWEVWEIYLGELQDLAIYGSSIAYNLKYVGYDTILKEQEKMLREMGEMASIHSAERAGYEAKKHIVDRLWRSMIPSRPV